MVYIHSCYNCKQNITINRMSKTLGEKIRFFRNRANMSQLDLELEIDASTGSLSRIEGGVTEPTRKTLNKIFEKLNLNSTEINYLLGITSESPTKTESINAIKEIEPHLNRQDVFAYLLDDHWTVHAVSIGLINLLKLKDNDIKELIGKNIIEIAYSENKKIRNAISSRLFKETIKYQLYRMHAEFSYLCDEDWFKSLIQRLSSNTEFSEMWKEIEDKGVTTTSYVSIKARTVHFNLNGENKAVTYSRERLRKYPRFYLVEYHL